MPQGHDARQIDLCALVDFFSTCAPIPWFIEAGPAVISASSYPEEMALVAGAVPQRVAEFCSGRHYARRALQRAGKAPVAIGRGERGQPLWPRGVLGSLSHDQALVLVALTPDDHLRGLGVDLLLEPDRVTPDMAYLIADPRELAGLAPLAGAVPPLALAFSVKEAVVKAVSPRLQDYLDFRDIRLSGRGGQLEAVIMSGGLGTLPATCDALYEETRFRCFFHRLEPRGLVTLALWLHE